MLDFILFLTAVIGRVHSEGRVSGVASDNITLNVTYDNVTHLINSMLKSYDIRLRPNFGGYKIFRYIKSSYKYLRLERPLVLDLDITVASFDSVSEVNMDFTLTMYLYQYWKDERLAWLPSYRNESITLGGDFSQRIWVPDTFLANDKQSYLHDVTETNKMIKLHSDGYIRYGMRFTSTLACKMDLRAFPLDRQNFSVEIESYGYTTDDLYMQWRRGRQSIQGVMETEIPQFRILDYEALNRIETTDTGEYQRLSLVLVLRRSVGYYMFQTYFPSTLIVTLSWISFWINHEATAARVALGVTTVLTMTTISTGVRASLPRISYVKAIDIYLVMCFVFVFAALLEYAAVNYTYWGSTRTSRRGRSDASVQPVFDRRKPFTSTVKEFPTWEMYVKNEDVAGVISSCRQRRKSRAIGDVEEIRTEYEMQQRHNGADDDSDDDKVEDVLTTDFPIDESDSDRLAQLTGHEGFTGRVSPIPGLLQQLRRQPIPEQCGASSSLPILEERGDDANWSSLMSSAEEARSSSPPVVLHTSSTMIRRRPSSTLGRTTFEQQVSGYGERDDGQRSRRRTHSLQGSKRSRVSFNIWKNKGVGSAPSSLTSSSRFQSRNSSLTRQQLVNSLRRKAKAVRAVLPRIHDVNVIDKWSRAMFPLSFIAFNFVYWCYYVFRDWKD